MRLFVAVDVGEEVRGSVRRLVAKMKSARREAGSKLLENARFVRPESAHLTLAFLGEVADERLADLVQSLDSVSKPGSFDVHFAGLGAFPMGLKARVLWIGAREGAEKLGALAEKVRQSTGVFRNSGEDEERYVPHLTLCRFRRPQNAAKLAIFSSLQETEVGTCRIDRFLLMRSHLHSDGSVHEALREFPFSAGSS